MSADISKRERQTSALLLVLLPTSLRVGDRRASLGTWVCPNWAVFATVWSRPLGRKMQQIFSFPVGKLKTYIVWNVDCKAFDLRHESYSNVGIHLGTLIWLPCVHSLFSSGALLHWDATARGCLKLCVTQGEGSMRELAFSCSKEWTFAHVLEASIICMWKVHITGTRRYIQPALLFLEQI